MPSQPTTDLIWSRLNDDLRRFIRRRVSDDHVAEDLLQETFVRVHRNLAALQDADRLTAWVYQIARNVINDHHRQAAKTTLALIDDPATEEGDRLGCLGSRSGEWLEEMVRQLPDGYREAVQLSEIDGLPQQEVADRLGLSLSGVKSRIQRGRMMLKDILDHCCHFEFDRRGNVMDYEPKPDRTVCRNCDELDNSKET
jgi:RNA polymerase sigma-70 factor (ECF subfamily)